MPYEYPTRGGVLRVLQDEFQWIVEFDGLRRSRWSSPDDAVMAAAHHATGLAGWDRTSFFVPDDLLRWRPIGDNL